MEIKYFYIKVRGKKIWVKQCLQKSGLGRPTLLFLHEGLGCIEMWKDFPNKLMAITGMNATVFDREGYGQSEPVQPPRPADYLEQAAFDWLPEIIKALNLEKPILVGHSEGGTISLLYAGQYQVTAVISEAAHVFVEKETVAGIKAANGKYKTTNLAKRLAKYHGDKTENVFRAWVEGWTRESHFSWNIEHFLSGVTCPALILQGEEDEYATEEQVIRIARGIQSTQKKTIMIPDAAHAPHFQAPKVTLAAMAEFIKELKV